MTIGYSDRINHALAYATKHHDQQVRRGTRSPYLTRHANVAVILARYGGDEDTVVAGILHDVVGDGMRGGMTRESLVGRVGEKFGGDALDLALTVSEGRAEGVGVGRSADERREVLLGRLPMRQSARAGWWRRTHSTRPEHSSLSFDAPNSPSRSG